MKYFVILAFVAILGSLGAALWFMMRNGGAPIDNETQRQRRMAKALALRVGFSVLLFVTVLIAYLLGWIHPTGLPAH